MKFLSVCSGIEAASVAWHPLGWQALAYSEIEKFPSSVLEHHYPQTPNLGDMTKFKEWNLGSDIDVFVGGTPCQSFSVAGLRKGLDDPRGNLMLTYLAIAKQFGPNWLVWENVPGVLSSNAGRDFGTFLGGLVELGYGFAYRVLDAQYFGVAQRRRRVFVVGYLGDWRPAAAVLFERHSLSGHPAPSREKRKRTARIVAPSLTASNDPSRSPQSSEVTSQIAAVTAARMVAFGEYVDDGAASTIKERDYKDATDLVAYTLRNEGFDASEDGTGRGRPIVPMAQPIPIDSMNHLGRINENHSFGDFVPGAPSYTLTKHHSHAVAHAFKVRGGCEGGGKGYLGQDEVAFTISTLQDQHIAQPVGCEVADTLSVGKNQTTGVKTDVCAVGMAVRRLTPVECERLQGFPDGYTDIKPKGKATPDGPRYKALGNSMAVPVMAWIGQRIKQVEAICKTRQNT